MRRFLFAFVILVSVYSCAKKATPVKSETGNTSTAATTTSETGGLASAEVLAAGKLTYDSKCGKCHDLPVTTAYTVEKWGPIVDAMAPKARLNETEKSNVLAFVKANAKQ